MMILMLLKVILFFLFVIYLCNPVVTKRSSISLKKLIKKRAKEIKIRKGRHRGMVSTLMSWKRKASSLSCLL